MPRTVHPDAVYARPLPRPSSFVLRPSAGDQAAVETVLTLPLAAQRARPKAALAGGLLPVEAVAGLADFLVAASIPTPPAVAVVPRQVAAAPVAVGQPFAAAAVALLTLGAIAAVAVALTLGADLAAGRRPPSPKRGADAPDHCPGRRPGRRPDDSAARGGRVSPTRQRVESSFVHVVTLLLSTPGWRRQAIHATLTSSTPGWATTSGASR